LARSGLIGIFINSVSHKKHNRYSPRVREVGKVRHDGLGKEALFLGVVVGEVKPGANQWNSEHIWQLLPGVALVSLEASK
jgi:hypothetical protein